MHFQIIEPRNKLIIVLIGTWSFLHLRRSGSSILVHTLVVLVHAPVVLGQSKKKTCDSTVSCRLKDYFQNWRSWKIIVAIISKKFNCGRSRSVEFIV